MKMVRVDPWVKWRNLGIFKIWEGVSEPEPPLFHLLMCAVSRVHCATRMYTRYVCPVIMPVRVAALI